jgi:hypothetical protein
MRIRNAASISICNLLFTCNILRKTQVGGTGKSLANVLSVREAANFQIAQITFSFHFLMITDEPVYVGTCSVLTLGNHIRVGKGTLIFY